MGILYVVGAPMGDLDDLTRRARRILGEVALVVAEDSNLGQNLLVHHGLTTPLRTIYASSRTADLDALFDTLMQRDLALLTSGWSMGPSQSSRRFIGSALTRGVRVVAVPGPSFPIAALVISGLPADSFAYLNRLPPDAGARQDLLRAVSGQRRTLILNEALACLPELYDALGDREMAIVASLKGAIQVLWRGPLSSAIDEFSDRTLDRRHTLVVGGAPEAIQWEETQLCQQVEALMDRGLGAKAISQQLAAESGWSRREIYRLALAARKDQTSS